MQLFLGSTSIFAGLTLAILSAYHGHWLSSVCNLLLGGVVGFYFVFGFWKSWALPEWAFVASVAGALGISAIINEHPGFDRDLSHAHQEVLSSLLGIETTCRGKTNVPEKLFLDSLKACAFTDQVEVMNAVIELQKAKTLGPGLSLADSIRSATLKQNPDWCAETYRAIRSICPMAFHAVSDESKVILEQLTGSTPTSNR